jgi:hypothetical protein
MSYDPAIDAQRRAAHRGLEDLEADTATKTHFAEKDLALALRGIRTDATRSRQDTNRGFNRGIQRLGNEEEDTRTKAGRTQQDFTTQLADIGRRFAELGQRQSEGANAAGVNDAGTAAASAAARGRNQALAEAPIHVAQGRLQEDLMTTLDRIFEARGQLGEDRSRTLGRLNQDRDIQRREVRRETGRNLFGLEREEERGRREAAITDTDLLEQAIFQARANHPGAFSKTGQKTSGAGGGKPAAKPALGQASPARRRKR